MIEQLSNDLLGLNSDETRYLTIRVREKLLKVSGIDILKLNTEWPAFKNTRIV